MDMCRPGEESRLLGDELTRVTRLAEDAAKDPQFKPQVYAYGLNKDAINNSPGKSPTLTHDAGVAT